MNIEQEIRDQIERNKELKQEVGHINNHLSILEGLCREDKQKQVDEAYQRGLGDAWEAARKIFGHEIDGGLDIDELKKAFGDGIYCTADIIRTNTAEQAIAKLKAYEENKDDPIKMGDIVDRYIDGKFDSRGIYLEEEDGYWKCLFDTGAVLMTFSYPKKQFKKTGKHFDIEGILEAMRS